MEIVNISLPATNKFATGYNEGEKNVLQYFHYDYCSEDGYKQRVEELFARAFMRDELADHIESFMKPFPRTLEVGKSLEKLRRKNSAVVIGGQQAGILTGPLYTIHKIISIISLAKQKEQELRIPVVPIFWIAGEDHDYAEVNHIFVENEGQMEKWVYPEKIADKRMVTDCPLNEEVFIPWVEDLMRAFGETDYSNEVLDFLKKAARETKTFVEFFSYIIMELFKEHGLLIVDSGNEALRKLEKKYFKKLIEQAPIITNAVRNQQEQLKQDGFPNMLQIGENSANLFFYNKREFERILLDYDREKNSFIGKNGSFSISFEKLLQLAEDEPETLSNNVVTRPIMQEFLFPTLAFIAGPGEIAYWAELKRAFEELGMKMPPIVPRLNITILERDVESLLEEEQLELEKALREGTEMVRQQFLSEEKESEFGTIFKELKTDLHKKYRNIEKKIEEDFIGLIPLFKKNEGILQSQIEFLENKIEEALQMKHDVKLKKLARIEQSLHPMGGPQERVWNIFYFLNKNGLSFVRELASLPYTFDGKHKVVKI